MATPRETLAECPACDARTPGEFDEVLGVYVCPCCSATWRLPRGHQVPAPPTAPRLPFRMTFGSEFEEDR